MMCFFFPQVPNVSVILLISASGFYQLCPGQKVQFFCDFMRQHLDTNKIYDFHFENRTFILVNVQPLQKFI